MSIPDDGDRNIRDNLRNAENEASDDEAGEHEHGPGSEPDRHD